MAMLNNQMVSGKNMLKLWFFSRFSLKAIHWLGIVSHILENLWISDIYCSFQSHENKQSSKNDITQFPVEWWWPKR